VNQHFLDSFHRPA
jgi:hypothetical protein